MCNSVSKVYSTSGIYRLDCASSHSFQVTRIKFHFIIAEFEKVVASVHDEEYGEGVEGGAAK